MPIKLTKVIDLGTDRYLGQLHSQLAIETVPIAGKTLTDLQKAIGGQCFRIGRVATHNAVVIEVNPAWRLLYVRPAYASYRRVAVSVFAMTPAYALDYDHALGRHLAQVAGYQYVLLLRIPPRINRSHGAFEKGEISVSMLPTVAYADVRIFDKCLGRIPRLMSGRNPAAGYRGNAHVPGLTLKQCGRLAFALGWGEQIVSQGGLAPFTPGP